MDKEDASDISIERAHLLGKRKEDKRAPDYRVI